MPWHHLMTTRCIMVLFAIATLPTSVALAYEDQWTFDLQAGVRSFASSAEVGAGVGVSYGLSDMFTARFQGQYFIGPREPTAHNVTLLGELIYVLDVLQWVPFFGAGLDGAMRWAAGDHATDLGAHGILGLDYLYDRNHMIGIDVRPVWWFDAEVMSVQGMLRWSLMF